MENNKELNKLVTVIKWLWNHTINKKYWKQDLLEKKN
jgi:hypothetical protein